MYEVILKWGFDQLSALANQQHDTQRTVVLEAIKAKNTLVEKRFDIATSATEALLELILQLEDDLVELRQSSILDGNRDKNRKQYIAALERDFHPRYYRRLKHVRGQFEMTNDVFSSYSIEATKFLHIRNIQNILNNCDAEQVSDINTIYRQMWNMVATTMMSLVRVTSTDLRFWLSDEVHGRKTDEWAAGEFDNIQKKILSYRQSDKPYLDTYYLSIEEEGGVDDFWKFVGNETNR